MQFLLFKSAIPYSSFLLISDLVIPLIPCCIVKFTSSSATSSTYQIPDLPISLSIPEYSSSTIEPV